MTIDGREVNMRIFELVLAYKEGIYAGNDRKTAEDHTPLSPLTIEKESKYSYLSTGGCPCSNQSDNTSSVKGDNPLRLLCRIKMRFPAVSHSIDEMIGRFIPPSQLYAPFRALFNDRNHYT